MPEFPRAAICALIVGLSASHGYAEVSDELAALATPLTEVQPAVALTDPEKQGTKAALSRKQDYLVIMQPVQTLLESVAREAGLRLSYSDAVKGVVSKVRATGTTSEVLDIISEEVGLDWFTFNGIIYVSSRNEATTRMVRLGDLTPGQAIEALGDAGLPLSRVETHPTSVDNVLALSGPPELLAIAEAVIESIPPHVVTPEKTTPVRTLMIRRGIDEHWITPRQ